MWCKSFPTIFRFNGYRNSVLRLSALSNCTGGGEERYLCAEKQPVLLLLVDGVFGLLLRKSSLRSILGCLYFKTLQPFFKTNLVYIFFNDITFFTSSFLLIIFLGKSQ